MKFTDLLERNEATTRLQGTVFEIAARGLITPDMPLREYVKQSFPVVEPSKEFMTNWHIDCMIEYLEAVELGQITRLNINLPPRNMKSILAAIQYPTWSWTQRSWKWFMFLSYSQNLSNFHSKQRRDLIMSSWYQSRWGSNVYLSSDQNQKQEFQNTAHGGMISSSIGGTVTGKGADVIIVDDGMDPQRAESKADREAANEFVRKTVFSRLNDKKTGAIINIAQRLHKEDTTATLLEEGEWVSVVLPAECTMKTAISFPISKRVIERQPGELLWPEREDKKVLDRQRRSMRERAYQAQYQQAPSNDEASFFKRGNWRFYKQHPKDLVASMDETIQTWDLSFKDLKTSDYVCGGVLGKKGPDFYLLKVVNDRLGFGASKMAIKTMTAEWPMAHAKLIEDKANGPAVIEETKKEVSGIIAINPKDSKEARASVAAAYQESGNVYLPDPLMPGCAWVAPFIEQCAEFPGGAHDDQVDMFTQGILWFANKLRNQPNIWLGEEEDELD